MKSKLPLLVACLVAPLPAHAHVKWFSMTADCAGAPITTFSILSSPMFIVLSLPASAVMFAIAAIDGRISRGRGRGARLAAWLDRETANLAAPLLRLGVAVYFVSIVICFQEAPIILTAELKTDAAWVLMVQLAIAATVLWRGSAILAALGIAGLFALLLTRTVRSAPDTFGEMLRWKLVAS